MEAKQKKLHSLRMVEARMRPDRSRRPNQFDLLKCFFSFGIYLSFDVKQHQQ